MNYESNTIQWQRGDIVIHDADAKEPRMLMKIVGFQRGTGLAKCQYVDQRQPRKIYVNELKYLHDPGEFGIDQRWGEYAPVHIERIQDEWEQCHHWNRNHEPGIRVRTTSADGGFEAVASFPARMMPSGHAHIWLKPGGGWWLKFVEPVQ